MARGGCRTDGGALSNLTSEGAPEKMKEAQPNCADVAELADALDSGSSSRKGVEVQVLSSAPDETKSVYEAVHHRAALVFLADYNQFCNR